jgi:ribosomal protein L40E
MPFHQTPIEEKPIKCPKCGAYSPSSYTACKMCGTDLSEAKKQNQ